MSPVLAGTADAANPVPAWASSPQVRVASALQDTDTVPVSMLAQLQELQHGTHAAEQQWQAAMAGMQQAAPGLLTAAEEMHAGVFGNKGVRAPDLLCLGQAAISERMQVRTGLCLRH